MANRLRELPGGLRAALHLLHGHLAGHARLSQALLDLPLHRPGGLDSQQVEATARADRAAAVAIEPHLELVAEDLQERHAGAPGPALAVDPESSRDADQVRPEEA